MEDILKISEGEKPKPARDNKKHEATSRKGETDEHAGRDNGAKQNTTADGEDRGL